MKRHEWEPGGHEFEYAFSRSDPELKIDLSEIVTGQEKGLLSAYRKNVLKRLNRGFTLVPYKIIEQSQSGLSLQYKGLVVRHTFPVKFSHGVSARVVYLEGRPRTNPEKKVDIVTQKFHRTRSTNSAQSQLKTLSALFGPRGRPHGKSHVVLGNQNLSQKMTCEAAELFLSVLALLGNTYEGFFNGPTAASHPMILHCHYWQERIPILSIDTPDEWPIEVAISKDRDVSQTAKWMAVKVAEFKKVKRDLDFVFRLDKGAIRAVAIPRVPYKRKPIKTLADGLEKKYDEHFGTFGVLEMAGYLVAVRTKDAFQKIHRNPYLYVESLKELSSLDNDHNQLTSAYSRRRNAHRG
jgi:hypothetical protein